MMGGHDVEFGIWGWPLLMLMAQLATGVLLFGW